ncbi:BlaI/MecI/CopY family transcriptional regulator [Jiangella sp. DSM 45060]|uniref:BlaI/MecI/CopY family transcriptional regulator n=1 Tax=Jiangella sp. DSM 45060 TaxID=1798224 RepID=UPI00087C2A6B|nr:BlaI/MecI/CopY family transcriptional regulator [Jiangella sp. DSM 45060]SDT60804.1 Predicted transcriptional regulator [Jiangella sp. DSM 45060]
MPGRARLGELERAVMEQLWALRAPATVRQVHEALAGSRDIAYTTVMTVLDRLARKGSAEQIRDGRAYRYRPAFSRDELTAELMHEALDTVDGSDRTAALLRFVGSASEDDARALREALEAVERSARDSA